MYVHLAINFHIKICTVPLNKTSLIQCGSVTVYLFSFTVGRCEDKWLKWNVAEFPYFNMAFQSWIQVWLIAVFPSIQFSHVWILYTSSDVYFYTIKFSVHAH